MFKQSTKQASETFAGLT